MGQSKQYQPQPTGPLNGSYPIRTVASITGVNPVTLRAWERRYKLIVPQRTPKGHRLYTKQDIERIRRVLDLLNQGMSIGQVTRVLDQQEDKTEAAAAEARNIWQGYQQRILAAIENYDELRLDAVYNDAMSLYPIHLVDSKLTTPLLRLFGERWKERPISVAEEHFFSFYLRNKLGSRVHHLNQRSAGPLLLLACVPDEYHELGMLFFALAAVNHGYRVLLLGANTPLELIPGVLERRACQGVVLSSSSKLAPGLLQDMLPALVEQLDIPVFVGGAITQRHANAIQAAGAIAVGEEMPQAVQQIGEVLASANK